MLKEEAAGRLYGALFLTHFRKLNLAYLDGYGENSELQQTLAMTFYRLRRLSPRWMSPAELAEELLMPQVLDPPSSDSGREDVYGQMESRVLTPLARFGLLDRKSVEGRYRFLPEMRYRRAPLFERFIRFRF